MPRKPSAKQIQKEKDQRFARIYAERCHGVQISIWDMSKVATIAYTSIDSGDDDKQVGDKIVAFVETVRKN